MNRSGLERKALTTSSVSVSIGGGVLSGLLSSGLELLLMHVPHGKILKDILSTVVTEGINYVRGENFKWMINQIGEYQPTNELKYEKLIEAVSRTVTDKLRDDIKSNNPDKTTTTWGKVSKWAKTIGNEIKGNAKESGPRFSKHLNKDGIADALGVLCYMIANADNSDVKSLSPREKKNRMVEFAIEARKKRKQKKVIVLRESVFKYDNNNNNINNNKKSKTNVNDNNSTDVLSTSNVSVNLVSNTTIKDELEALKQQMKLKDEEIQNMQQENRKIKKQIKAVQETVPTAKEKKKLKKLLKEEEGEQVLLKRPGTDANLVNKMKDMERRNQEQEERIKRLEQLLMANGLDSVNEGDKYTDKEKQQKFPELLKRQAKKQEDDKNVQDAILSELLKED